MVGKQAIGIQVEVVLRWEFESALLKDGFREIALLGGLRAVAIGKVQVLVGIRGTPGGGGVPVVLPVLVELSSAWVRFQLPSDPRVQLKCCR